MPTLPDGPAASSRSFNPPRRRWRLCGLVLTLGCTASSAGAGNLFDMLRNLDPRARQQDAAQQLEARCKALVDWAGSMPAAATPPPLPSRRAPGAAAPAELPATLRLFADASFKPVFGKAFDEFTPSERLALHNDYFVGCGRSRTYAAAVQRIGYTLGAPFADVGGPAPAVPGRLGAAQVIEAVQRMRQAGGETQALLAELQALPGTASSWPALMARRPQVEEALRYLPPAEAAAARDALRQTALRLAGPAAAAVTEQAPADSEGSAALPALRRARDALAGIEAVAPAPEVQAARANLTQRHEAIVRNAVAQERLALDGLSPGAEGLEPGAQWQAGLLRNLDDEEARRSPEVQALLRDHRAKRDRQLADALAGWQRQVREARTAEELSRLLAGALPLPGDAQSAPGQALRLAVQTRQEDLHKARVLGEQAREQPAPRPAVAAASPAPAAPAAVAGSAGEPTAAEMYDVIQARFNGIAAEFNRMQGDCKRGGAKADPASAMLCLSAMVGGSAGVGEPMKIARFEKLGCALASGKAGYACDYMLGVSGGSTGAMGSMMASMMGRGGVAQARFIRSSNGWIGIFGEKP